MNLLRNKDMIDRLEKWHSHFRFAEANLADIFVKADLFDAEDLGDAGRLLAPKGFFKHLAE